MKVLNWLQQRVHLRGHYCLLDESNTKSSVFVMGGTPGGGLEDVVRESIAEQDTEALLLRDVLLKGILTIGTFGHQQSSFSSDHDMDVEDYPAAEKFGDLKSEDTSEKNEAAVRTAAVISPIEPVAPFEQHNVEAHLDKAEGSNELPAHVVLIRAEEDEDIRIQEKALLVQAETVEHHRTTLADLFAAELFSSIDVRIDSKKDGNAAKVTCTPTLAKKKEHGENGDKCAKPSTKATKYLGQFMKRMLRKKIHPEKHSLQSAGPGRLMDPRDGNTCPYAWTGTCAAAREPHK